MRKIIENLILFTAQYFFIVIILIVIIYIHKQIKLKNYEILKLYILSLPLAYFVSKILAFFIQDPRPFIQDNVKPLITSAMDNGFPSDHTLLVMTLSIGVFLFNKKLGGILIFLSFLVGLSRVYARVHHLLDVAGSAIIALCTVYVVYFILKKIKTKIVNK